MEGWRGWFGCGPLPIIATTAIITLLVGPARLCQQLLAQLRFPSLWVKMVKTPDKSARKTLGLPHVLLQMTDSKGISFYLQRVDLVNVAPLNLFFANRCWLLLIPGRWYVTCLKGDVRFSRNMCNYQRRRVLVKDLTNCKKVSILLGRLGGHGTWLSFWHSLRSFLQWLENRLCQTRWMFKLVELVHAPSGEQKNYNIRQAWYSRPRAPLVAGCSIQSTVNLERYHHLKPEKKWRKRQEDTKSPMKYPTH